MSYITEEDFEEAFGRPELDDLLGGGSDFANVQAAASGLIDGYLASKYSLPLVTVPALVKGWALDITRFRLWDEQAPEEVRRRYEDALEQLRDLAAGRLALPPGADGTPSTPPLDYDAYSNERVFTADTLKDF